MSLGISFEDGGGGGGEMGGLICVRMFFPEPLVIEFFITLHAALYTMKNICF